MISFLNANTIQCKMEMILLHHHQKSLPRIDAKAKLTSNDSKMVQDRLNINSCCSDPSYDSPVVPSNVSNSNYADSSLCVNSGGASYDDMCPGGAKTVTPCSLGFADDYYFDDYNHEDNDFEDDRDESTNIYTYPSGRLPLVPIDTNDTGDKKILHRTKKGKEEKKKESSRLRKTSWLSKTFCVLPSNLDTVGDLSNDGIITNSSFDDENICFVSDEGSIIIEDEHDEDEIYIPARLDNRYLPEPKTQVKRGMNSIIREQAPRSFDDAFDVLFQNSLICNTWQNWYDEEDFQMPNISQTVLRFRSYDYPHNSSCDPTAKKKRIQYLRQNMTPFDIDELEFNQVPSNMHMSLELKKKTTSFSSARKKAKPRAKSAKRSPKEDDCEWHSNIIATCGNFSQTQEIEIVPSDNFNYDDDNDFLCYDSDPSDLIPSYRSSRKSRLGTLKEKRREHESTIEKGDLDEATSVDMICEHMTTRRLLVWHRESKQASAEPPVVIHAWIEHGSQLDSILVQPKFCWQEAYIKETQNKSVFKNSLTYHAVDLLDISKIMPIDDVVVDRERHPFVKRSSSFLVEAFGGFQEMIFEARDEAERDDIIEGLKLVVARLGSKIIVGDSTVLSEFFSPLGASVPGSIPDVLSGEIDSN